MMSSEETLENVARDGSLDISEWPRVLESLLNKLHDIVHNDFPLPSLHVPTGLSSTIDPDMVASTPPPVPDNDMDLPSQELPGADENEPPPNSQSSTKENDMPGDIAASRRRAAEHMMDDTPKPTHPPDSIEVQAGALPPDLLSLYQTSTRILEQDFAHSPPYTVQRLAEMILHPRRHYRFLPAYLRALDRIISVSSPISDFPLPTMNASANGGFLTNGDGSQINGVAEREGLGSDESLGGALLTPIPWLRNPGGGLGGSGPASQDGELHSESTETIEGPNGSGSIETVSVIINGVPSASSLAHTSPTPVSPTLSEQSDASSNTSSESTEAQLRQQGGVTQGELLRQEQEAGVVPVSQTSIRRSIVPGGVVGGVREPVLFVSREMDGEERFETMDDQPDELPHARGPEFIGMEDMGPQQHPLGGNRGLDMEAAVGRAKSPPATTGASPPSMEPTAQTQPSIDAFSGPILDLVSDDAGQPGKDPQDVMKEVEKLREVMDAEKVADAKDSDGDVVVADADGRVVEEMGKHEVTNGLSGAGTGNTTTP